MAVGNKAYKRVSMKELDKYFSGELDPNIQYASREVGIKAHAEDYSFNIESVLFQQLSKEQQKQWKPSEEQMKTLNEVINYCANGKEAYLNDYIYNRLIDLRDELNKL
jgi:hypothetical protein